MGEFREVENNDNDNDELSLLQAQFNKKKRNQYYSGIYIDEFHNCRTKVLTCNSYAGKPGSSRKDKMVSYQMNHGHEFDNMTAAVVVVTQEYTAGKKTTRTKTSIPSIRRNRRRKKVHSAIIEHVEIEPQEVIDKRNMQSSQQQQQEECPEGEYQHSSTSKVIHQDQEVTLVFPAFRNDALLPNTYYNRMRVNHQHNKDQQKDQHSNKEEQKAEDSAEKKSTVPPVGKNYHDIVDSSIAAKILPNTYYVEKPKNVKSKKEEEHNTKSTNQEEDNTTIKIQDENKKEEGDITNSKKKEEDITNDNNEEEDKSKSKK